MDPTYSCPESTVVAEPWEHEAANGKFRVWTFWLLYQGFQESGPFSRAPITSVLVYCGILWDSLFLETPILQAG